MEYTYTFKEYNVDLTKIEECLPWARLTDQVILQNKDDSLMGFFQYSHMNKSQPLLENLSFGNGWTLWSERQHLIDSSKHQDQFFITLLWNPFFNKNLSIYNTLDHSRVNFRDRISYFSNILEKIKNNCQKEVDIQILSNDDILKYLRSTLTLSTPSVPEAPPLYLDALLSQDLGFTVRKNNIEIDGKNIGILTPLGYLEPPVLETVFSKFEIMPYRFVRRFIFCDEKTFKKEQNRYMSLWCSGRSSMLQFLKDRLEGHIFGFDTSSFIFFHTDIERLQDFLKKAESILRSLGIPSITEDFNKKDVFWGSLPGLFRANIVPPMTKADNFAEFFLCDYESVKEKQDV